MLQQNLGVKQEIGRYGNQENVAFAQTSVKQSCKIKFPSNLLLWIT